MIKINNKCDLIDSQTVEKRINDLSNELATLMRLRKNFPGTPTEWIKGTIFVSGEFFEEHIKQIAAEQLDLDSWPLHHVDWAAASCAQLKNYDSIDFDGVAYWIKKSPN